MMKGGVMQEKDPNDQWTDPPEISEVSFSGVLKFSCCRKVHTVQGTDRSETQCSVCGTLYGLALLVRLQPAEDHHFAKGTRIRVVERLEVKAGSTIVVLEPSKVYEAGSDVHGSLNVPVGHQPLLVEVRGDRGSRKLVAMVPIDRLVKVE
jgi:hypothetical protein